DVSLLVRRSTTVKVFVDSNVIIYSRDRGAAAKQARADTWLVALAERECGVISPQIVGEVMRVFTDKLGIKHPGVLDELVERLSEWTMASHDMIVIRRAIDVKLRWAFEWWDCVTVAAAQLSMCDYLLTEDLQDRQNLDGLLVLNPFHNDPS